LINSGREQNRAALVGSGEPLVPAQDTRHFYGGQLLLPGRS